MLRSFAKSIPDIALCSCLAVCLTFAVCSGFEFEGGQPNSVLVTALISFAAQTVFSFLSRRRLTRGIGIVAGALLAAAAIAYSRAHQPTNTEALHGMLSFACIFSITSLLVFLLSLSRPGLIVLFMAGSFICAGAGFLQFPIPAWCLILFLAASAFLFLYRVFTVSISGAELGGIPKPAYLKQTAIVCLAALALATGFYMSVIRPASPPTLELRLITVLLSMDTLEVLGVSGIQTIMDPEQESEELPDDMETSNMQDETLDDIDDSQQETFPINQDEYPDTGITRQQEWESVTYDRQTTTWLWLLALIPAAIIFAYIMRADSKKRWRERVRSLSPENAVINYYHFFLKRLARVGIKKPGSRTLREFVENNEFQLQPFVAKGCTFADLTTVYEETLYGRRKVSEADILRFEAFFDGFYKALRGEIGSIRYFLLTFRY